jgi:uncharacterized membrane protein YcaP (DUF421 family)
MKTNEINFSDWQWILLGELPSAFYGELVLRAAFTFLLLIISMRLMGKRMSAQISRNEMAALVSLAAAIGVPLQSADRGLFPAIAIAIVVVLAQRYIASKTFANQRIEDFALGNISMLITDSVMDKKVMLSVRLTKERLMAQLRSQSIKHLGEVKRLYLEADGSFTLVRNKEEVKPGLSVIPFWDIDYISRYDKSNILVCSSCGKPKQDEHPAKCSVCGKKHFEAAIG